MCHDGGACINKARSWKPDAAVLDIAMPGMSGYEVARTLRAMDFGARIVIVAVTGYASEEGRASAMEAGFDAYLTKTVELKALVNTVKRGRSQ